MRVIDNNDSIVIRFSYIKGFVCLLFVWGIVGMVTLDEYLPFPTDLIVFDTAVFYISWILAIFVTIGVIFVMFSWSITLDSSGITENRGIIKKKVVLIRWDELKSFGVFLENNENRLYFSTSQNGENHHVCDDGVYKTISVIYSGSKDKAFENSINKFVFEYCKKHSRVYD